MSPAAILMNSIDWPDQNTTTVYIKAVIYKVTGQIVASVANSLDTLSNGKVA